MKLILRSLSNLPKSRKIIKVKAGIKPQLKNVISERAVPTAISQLLRLSNNQ